MITTDGQDAVDALIAHASQDCLGEDVDLTDVELAIADLHTDPMGASKLRRSLAKRNNKEICTTLEDWLLAAARARDSDAKDASRPNDKVMGPVQAVSLGAVVTGIAFGLAGSMAPISAGVMIVAGLTSFGATSIYRLRLSRREDEAEEDAGQIRRLAEIAAREAQSTSPHDV